MNNDIFNLCHFIGETVTIFTASGGASGCGFSGVLLSVNPCFIRLMTRQGTPPANPISESFCGSFAGAMGSGPKGHNGIPDMIPSFTVGSVCDIPIEKIVSFCHNAV
ncbi:MAG TPA: hypothetical protein VJZ06_00210 [Mobilitalea sp.]|nr:hypothetical protein [Mobilitalea sp.]